MPFFSNTKLPRQQGLSHEVRPLGAALGCVPPPLRTDPRAVFLIFSDGGLPSNREPRSRDQVYDFKNSTDLKPTQKNYYCVRTSFNGEQITQLCNDDPTSGTVKGAAMQLIQGACELDPCARSVRPTWRAATQSPCLAAGSFGSDGRWPIARVWPAAVLLCCADLKQKHWIDFQTRFVVFTLQLRVPNAGLAGVVDLMFEFPAAGGVLPSFQVVTARIDEEAVEQCRVQASAWAWLGQGGGNWSSTVPFRCPRGTPSSICVRRR